MAADQHPDKEFLIALHEGRLDEAELDRIVEHVVSCDGCRQELDELAGTSPLSQCLRRLAVEESTCDQGIATWVNALQKFSSFEPLRFGDYRIVREIGRGGMGIVYEAIQESLERRVALKVLPFQAATDRHFIDRFRRESQAVARLHHTNIVPIFAVGDQGGLPYFAMQLISGRSLAAVHRELRRRHDADHDVRVGPFDDTADESASPKQEQDSSLALWLLTDKVSTSDVEETVAAPIAVDTRRVSHGTRSESATELTKRTSPKVGKSYYLRIAQIGIQIADALGHAHSRGVLHRDIKPSNVLMDELGTIWLTDFGLAKLADAGELTENGALVGTLRYMPPERFQGQADARSDIYSLGVTLYELITFRPAFAERDRGQLMRRVLNDDPLRPRILQPGLPHDLETVVLKAMAKDPAERYTSALEMANDLRRFAADMPITARRAPIWERLARWCRRNPAAAAASVLAGITMMALIGLGLGVVVHARTQEALALARSERQRAEAERQQSEHLSARLALERGLALCEQGESGRGLLWLGRTLKLAAVHADPLEATSRVNLAGWSRELHPLRFTFQHSTVVDRTLFSPDSRYLIMASHQGVEVRDVETCHLVYPPLVHPHELQDVAVSPDGMSLATVGSDDTVRMWQLSTGKPGAVLQPDGSIVSVTFSPDGRWLITGSNTASHRRPIHIWDATTAKEVGRTEAAADIIRAIAVSPDGRTLAAATWQKVKLFRLPTGEPLGALPHDEYAVAVAFTSDGRTIATGSWDGTARVWNAETLEPRVPPLRHTESVYSIAFSPAGDMLITGCDDGAARLWNVSTGAMQGLPLQHQAAVKQVAFSPDGQWVASAGDDGAVRLWNASNGNPIGPPLMHRDRVDKLAISPNGQYLVAACREGSVRVWELRPREGQGLTLKHGRAVSCVTFRPDGQVALTGSWDRTARLWNAKTGEPTGPTFTNDGRVLAVAFSPDGQTVLTAGYGHSAQLWRADTGEPIGQPLRHNDAIRAIAFSGDGRFVATASGEATDGGTALVWSAKTGETVGQPIRHRREMSAVAFTRDGKLLLTGSVDGAARLWSSETCEPFSPVLSHGDTVNALAFSPSGKLAVTASSDRTAKIWTVSTEEVSPLVLPHEARVLTVAFSPDGSTVATGTGDGTARLWNSATGTALGTAMQHQGAIHAVAFSADGQWLATASADGTARLWDATSGEPLGMPLRHRGPVYAVAFNPVRRQLLTGSRDATARLWHPPDPIPGTVERVALWAEVLTGMSLDDAGIIRILDPEKWQDHRRQLDALGGPPQ